MSNGLGYQSLLDSIRDPDTYKEADRIYSQTYRTTDPIHPDEIADDPSYYIMLVCEELMQEQGKTLPDTADEYSTEIYYEECNSYKEQAEKILHSGTVKFVSLVNYKGEGIGASTERMASKLPLFISKYNYC